MRVMIALLATLVIFIQCNSKQEIAQWRGPERNGIYPETNLLTSWPQDGPKLLWRCDSLGNGYASAAVTSEKVYTIGTIDSISFIFAFDHSGDLQWKKVLGKDWTRNWPGVRATPVIYKDFGYVSNGLGVIFCFDAENGEIVWTKDVIQEFKGSYLLFGLCENLIVDEDKVYCTPAGDDATFIALDRRTGDLIWKTPGNSDSTSYCSPIIIQRGNKKYFINQTSSSLYSVDTENGEIAWKYDLKKSPMPATPVYRDGYLFALDGWDHGSFMLKVAEDGKSVSEVWKSSDLKPQQGDMVVIGNKMYGIGGNSRKFSCYDWNSGKEIYGDSTRAQIVNMISADGLLYTYDLRGIVNLVKPTESGFDTLGTFRIKGGNPQLHCSHPVIKDGRLYIRHDNSLFVYDISAS